MFSKVIVDWRGPGSWGARERERDADLFSVWQGHGLRPNLHGATIVAFSAMLYQSKTGGTIEPWGTYLPRLYGKRGPLEVWSSPFGDRTVAVDMAALALRINRSKLHRWAIDVVERYAWADGLHWDYWTDLSWLCLDEAGRPAFDYDWQAYLAGLYQLAEVIRSHRPDWYLLGQNFHFPRGDVGPLDGLFLEDPTGFGKTLADHAENLSGHRDLCKLSGRRAPAWVAEIREPGRIAALPGGPEYLTRVAAWCRDQGVGLSWGRDATAGLGFPA